MESPGISSYLAENKSQSQSSSSRSHTSAKWYNSSDLMRIGRRTAGGVLESEFPNLTWIEGSFQNSIPDNISVEFLEQKNNEDIETSFIEGACSTIRRNSKSGICEKCKRV